MEALCKDHCCCIMFTCKQGGCNMEFVHATSSVDFNRKVIPEIEHLIEENWQNMKNEIEILYNAEKFRIHSVKEKSDRVILDMGLTCYKDYIGTNLGKNLDTFRVKGVELFNDRQACLSDALGVGSMVVTADGYFLFVRRSFEVAEGRGMTDFPGGHAEPMEMRKQMGISECDLGETDASSMESKDVIYEIFYSMVREVRDEINIPEASLSWPVLLGFLRNVTNGGKPHASFLIRCDLSKEKITELFNEGGPEAYESTDILFFKEEELVKMSADQIKTKLGELTPCAKATLHLYFNGYK